MNMRFFKSLALCTVVPLLASACEGPCINGTTNKFIEKYQVPVNAFVDRIVSRIAFPSSRPTPAPLILTLGYLVCCRMY